MADVKNDPKVNPSVGTDTKKKGLSLLAKIQAVTNLSLKFIGVTPQKDTDGKFIAILTLANPIPLVRGSQEVDYKGKRTGVNATDVKEVKVHQEDFENNPDFVFDEDTDTGEYNGSSLMLDVAKSGQVWLKSTSFASSGRQYRTTARNERLEKLLGGTATEDEGQKPKPTI